MPSNAVYVDEFRGTDHLVYAEVLTDNNAVGEGYTTGAVKVLAPVAEISKTVETASDTKYYDNKPALTINAEGADTITLTVPALPLSVLADITGKSLILIVSVVMLPLSVPPYAPRAGPEGPAHFSVSLHSTGRCNL